MLQPADSTRVYLIQAGQKQDICSCFFKQYYVLFNGKRVLAEIIGIVKLCRIDKDAANCNFSCGPCRFDQAYVTLMKGAHGGNETHRPPFSFFVPDMPLQIACLFK